ncbi:MAG: outer membrane protein [Variibacter sp.]
MAKTTSILSLAGAALAFSVAGAAAADLPVKAPMMAPIQAFDWSGYYAGVGIGGQWSDFDWVYVNGATPNPRTQSRDRAVYELHGGAQYQFGGLGWGGLVVGYEYSGTFDMDSHGTDGAVCPNVAFNCQVKMESLFTIGGKLGLAWDRFMLYGQGGWAGAYVRTNGVVPATGVIFEQTKQWHNGWYVGGGLDYAFYHTAGTDWIIGVDYKHVELDTVYHQVTPGNVTILDRNITPTSDQLLARLTVKFQGPLWPFASAAPVAARY